MIARPILGLALACASAMILVATVSAHNGVYHYVKQLWSVRAYQNANGNYAAWMTLSTSDGWYFCDGGDASCRPKWESPLVLALNA